MVIFTTVTPFIGIDEMIRMRSVEVIFVQNFGRCKEKNYFFMNSNISGKHKFAFKNFSHGFDL